MAEGVDEKTIPKLTVDELGEFLSSKFDDDVIESLRANKVGIASHEINFDEVNSHLTNS